MIEILLAALAIVSLGLFCASEPRRDYWTGGALMLIGLTLGTVAIIAWWDASRDSWALREQERPDRQLHLRRGAGAAHKVDAPDRGQQVRR